MWITGPVPMAFKIKASILWRCRSCAFSGDTGPPLYPWQGVQMVSMWLCANRAASR